MPRQLPLPGVNPEPAELSTEQPAEQLLPASVRQVYLDAYRRAALLRVTVLQPVGSRLLLRPGFRRSS